MPTDLAKHIQQTPLCDTHEHMRSESDYVDDGPDILQNLFGNYVPADLVVAGASEEAVNALLSNNNPDIRVRFENIRPAWEAVRHTGYGEAVSTIARELYGIDELSSDAIEAAVGIHEALCRPGQRLNLLRERANLDHIQTDDFTWPCVPDDSGPDFFFYDISWATFCSGTPGLEDLAQETGIEVSNIGSLQQAMEALFEKYSRHAIAPRQSRGEA